MIEMVAWSRLGAAVFVVFYGASDTLMGIATGILARGAGDLPTELREGRAEAIAMLFEDPIAQVLYFVGELGWLVGLLAAVVALRGWQRLGRRHSALGGQPPAS